MNYVRVLELGLATILAVIIVYKTYSQITESFLQEDPMILDLARTLNSFIQNKKEWTGELVSLNKGNLFDHISIYKGDKSYTLNKEKIYLCLTDENGNYYSKNTLMYVLIHEMAHVISDSVGHTGEFHTTFEQLQDEAAKAGIYDPSIPIESNYCGYET